MKKLLLAFVTAVSLGNLPAADEVQPESSLNVRQGYAAGHLEEVRLGLVTRTTALIGMKVRDRRDSSLGKMEDVLLDLASGQAVAALFSSGADSAVTPVPARSFRTATRNKVLVDADKKTLKSAPGISRADLSQPIELSRLSPSFMHFRQELMELPAGSLGRLSSAARIVHQRLLAQSHEPLGEVEDVVVDLPAARIVYLLIRPAASAGSEGVLYAVPPQLVRPDATGPALVLKTDPPHFLAGPHFQTVYWTEMNRPEFAASVHQHYNLLAAAQNAPPPSDREITQAVVAEIVRNDRFYTMRDLKITTSNGRVTLASHRKSERQTQQLVAAASRVVGAAKVDNQLATPSSQ